MNKRYKIEWHYEPTDFYQVPATVIVNSNEVVFDGGKATTLISNVQENEIKQLIKDLSRRLQLTVLSLQSQLHKRLELTEGNHYSEICSDGSEGNKFISVPPITITMSATIGAVIIKDADGNVISDSRTEIVNAGKSFAELVLSAPSGDPIILKLLTAYGNAVSDPLNELVHLYEIRDTLNTEYKPDTLKTLGLNTTRWKRFGKLANDEPVNQGRHRGRNKELRDATLVELEEARSFSIEMIKAFIIYRKFKSSKP